MKLSSNVFSDSNYEANFPYKILLTNTQVLSIHKAFETNSTGIIKLSKTQLHKIRQLGGLLGRSLGTLKWIAFNENVLKTLAKSVLVPLGLTAAAAATDVAIHKENVWSRCEYTDNLKCSNEWYNEKS